MCFAEDTFGRAGTQIQMPLWPTLLGRSVGIFGAEGHGGSPKRALGTGDHSPAASPRAQQRREGGFGSPSGCLRALMRGLGVGLAPQVWGDPPCNFMLLQTRKSRQSDLTGTCLYAGVTLNIFGCLHLLLKST